jgi:hypothetical protein
MASIESIANLSKSYSDQTGRFPVRSSRGHQYIFVLYNYDSNSIHALPLKNRQAAEIARAWTTTYDLLQRKGVASALHILDNECSTAMKLAFRKHNVAFQLVPPHSHRRNAAERAIRTFKNHLCAGIATCDENFPSQEWDRLLPQATITLNLLRSSRIHPSISAHAAIHGIFDFNTTPLAPPGTRIVVHENSNNRTSFGTHATDGWYIGPALDHYRCYHCYIPSTASTRNADTVDFFPKQVPFPKTNTDDYLRQAAEDIVSILSTKRTSNPSLTYGSPITNAYTHIAQILRRATTPPSAPAPPTLPAPLPRVPAPLPRVPEARPQAAPAAPAPLPRVQAPIPRVPEAQPTAAPAAPMHGHNTRNRERRQFLAQAATQPTPHMQHFVNAVTNPISGNKESLDSLLKGDNATQWATSLANEFFRLSRGGGKTRAPTDSITGTDTIFFISKQQVPAGKKVTYSNFLCDIKPLKKETHRVRLTVGGDRLDYFEDASSPAVGLLETKIHLNSVISDAHKGARYMCLDIANFYLNNPMDDFQYMKIPVKYIPQEVMDEYDLHSLVCDGYVHVEIRKGMYGLKEAGIIAYRRIVKKLQPHGYQPVTHTPGLWHHTSLPTTFTLAVDDFGVKYFRHNDALHLIQALEQTYHITIDWTGSKYCGLTINWNYAKQYVDISMPGYISKALHRFQHTPPTRPQHAPHQWTTPTYGAKVQFAPTPSNAPLLDRKGKPVYKPSLAHSCTTPELSIPPCS